MRCGCLRRYVVGAVVMVGSAMVVGPVTGAAGEAYMVKDGRAQAEIVISEKPARMVKLAATELQAYLAKISGAKLPGLPKKGPIALQHHGDPIQFANIYIKELD